MEGLALLIATGFYIQYRWQIRLGFIVVSLVVELLTCMIYYKGKKNRILYDKNLRKIAIFNIVSIIMVPALIGITSSSIYNSKIDFDIWKRQITSMGIIQAYFNSSLAQYVMFQMVGMFFVGIFLLYIVISDLYLISVINVVMEKKGMWFWRWLLGRTCGKSKDGGRHIIIGTSLIVISIVITIGILPYILNLLQQTS